MNSGKPERPSYGIVDSVPKAKKQLVCQHLENISRKALEKYQHLIRDFVRQRHGIYALYRKDRLYYVGLASNLRGRLTAHLRDRHAQTWDRFSIYLTVGDEKLRELEALMIRISIPSGNRQKGRFVKSQDLKREFKNMIAEEQRQEREHLLNASPAPKKRRARKAPKRQKGQPILGPYIKKACKIRGFQHGKTYRATVRADGSIRYNKEVYNSPSMAGKAARGCTTNGWTWWKYERAPGDWVPLRTLRR